MPSDHKNSFWLAVQYISTLIISFVTIKINMVHFGNELFGMWIALSSLWTMGTALDLGFGLTVIKYLAEATKNNDNNERNSIASNAFVIFLVIGSIVFAIGIFLSFTIYYFNEKFVTVEIRETATLLIPIMGINFLIQYLSIFFRSVFEGLNYFSIAGKVGIIYNILILAAVITVSLCDLTLIELTWMYCLASISVLITFAIILKKRFPEVKIKLKLFSPLKVREMINFSIFMQISSILGALMDPVVKYILGNYSSLSFVTFYEVARRFAVSISGLFYATFRTFIPKSSVLSGKEEYNRYFLSDGVKLSNMGITYSGITFGILAIAITTVISLWFGYTEIVIMYLILSIPEAINNFSFSIYVFLLGVGKTFMLAVVQLTNLFTVVFTLLLGFYLFDSYIGLLGYSISVAISFFVMLIYSKSRLNIETNTYVKRVHVYRLSILVFTMLAAFSAIFYIKMNIFIIISIMSLANLLIFFNLSMEYTNQIMIISRNKFSR